MHFSELERSLRSRIARNAGWSVVGTGVYQGLLVATSIITARLLGGATFGQFGVVQTTTAMFGGFIGTALGLASTKHIAQYRDTDPMRAGRVLGLCAGSAVSSGVVASAVLLALAQRLATDVFHEPSLTRPLQEASLLLLFNIWNGSQQGVLAGFEAFRAVARINIIRGVLTVAGSAWAVLHWKFDGAIWALTISSAVACFLSTQEIRKESGRRSISVAWQGAWRERHILGSFALPSVLTGAVIPSAGWMVNALVANQPDGFTEVGALTAANQWRLAVCLLPSSLSQVAMPRLSHLLGEADSGRYSRTLQASLLFSLLISTLATIPVLMLSGKIMRSYGPCFEGRVMTFIVMQLAAILTSVSTGLGSAIATTGQMWANLLLNIIWAVMLTTLVYVQHPSGSRIAAWAYVGAYLTLCGLQTLLLRRSYPPRNAECPSPGGRTLSIDTPARNRCAPYSSTPNAARSLRNVAARQ